MLLGGRHQITKPFTPRTWEALGLLAQGRDNQAIGRAMSISIKRAENYAREIYQILDLSPQQDKRVGACLWYLSHADEPDKWASRPKVYRGR